MTAHFDPHHSLVKQVSHRCIITTSLQRHANDDTTKYS